jgi:hypothetical protein
MIIFLHTSSSSSCLPSYQFLHPSILTSHLLTNAQNRILTLRRRTSLQSHNITHIVSVLKYDFKDFEDWEKYEHLSIDVDDVEDENLLGEFERSGKFIEEGLRGGGGVLVHWWVFDFPICISGGGPLKPKGISVL